MGRESPQQPQRRSRCVAASQVVHLPLIAAVLLAIAAPDSRAQATGEEPSAGQLDTVTVRARRFSDRFDATASRLIVGREQIEASGASTVGDLLRTVPGLQVTTTPNGGLEIRMRGMSAQGTRILIDGAPVSSTRRDVQLPLDELPADLIERIEVMRAPTAEYEGASGGTLNIVLKQARAKRETYVWLTDQHVWGRDALVGFVSQSGPIGTPRPRPDPAGGALDRAAIDAADWSYFVSLTGGPRNLGADTRRESVTGGGDVRTASDEPSRLRTTSWTLTPRLQGRLGASDQLNIRSLLSTVDQHGQVTGSGTDERGGITTPTSAIAPWRYTREFGQLAADWTHRFRAAKLESTLGAERASSAYALRRESTSIAGGGPSLRTSTLDEDRVERGYVAKNKLTTSSGETIWTFGADLSQTSLDVDGRSGLDGVASPQSVAATLRSGALWAQSELPVEALESTVVLGLRAQRHAIEGRSAAGLTADSDTTYLQPSFNARTRLDDDTQLRVNVARVTRTPRIWELLDRPVPNVAGNSPNSPDFRGNPALRPESTLTLDVGTEHRFGARGQAGIGVFVRDQHDVIARRLSLDTGRWTERPDNVGDALVWGIESDVRTDLRWAGLPSDWTLSASANVFQSRMRSGDTVGSRIPGQARYVANTTIAKPLRVAGGWYGGGTLALIGRADLDQPAADGVRIEGVDRSRAQLDLYVGSVLPNLGFWRLNVYNVTDYKRDSQRSIVDANGLASSSRTLQTLTPRVFLTVGTRF